MESLIEWPSPPPPSSNLSFCWVKEVPSHNQILLIDKPSPRNHPEAEENTEDEKLLSHFAVQEHPLREDGLESY